METVITVAVILAVITLGALLIHRLNAQRDERIAVFRYSRVLPGLGGRRPKRRRQPGPAGPPGVNTHREHHGRGRR
ncbi:hypothetical protein [Streptomyces gobiensis]|uniref:hypothetical protein n=1 Tax=Streptomyces gobiensis TaxID=2875706 RepID=UPI001E5D3730|nr:hypothetical protein [Streptomyces gobiensis]UGY94083.1 hypothetical protein test1122_21765 [Streptomyces gobiensis]